ncbi:MAG: GAF and ANTAR domain-containing protein, partial [Actinomycetota bacterium]|nr:GAF and ANTAR domain-containing protein [Actinomycetota bacterium]
MLRGVAVVDLSNAVAFAEIARELASPRSLDETLQRAVDFAARTIDGCDSATISFVHRGGKISSPAFSDPFGRDADALQYEVGEGPCLTAIREHKTHLVDDLGEEERWPKFRERALELGVRSMLTFRLFLEHDTLGALNLYSRRSHAFDDDAVTVGTIFASHSAVALKAAISEAGQEAAIQSRDVIGQAKGIIMERQGLSADAAFNLLREISQRENRRIRDLADEIARTGEIPG